jgi:hypothetical protein
MKKILLTLAALFIASTALADSGFFFGTFDESTLGTTNESYLTLSREDLTRELKLSLEAYWSARVSGTECTITFPEGMHAVFAEPGADCTVNTLNFRGRPATETASVYWDTNTSYNHFITTFSAAGYYRNADGNLEMYGVNKWEAGYYEEMMLYTFQFDEGFTGGDIVVETGVASGYDTRGGTVRENGEQAHSFTFTCHVSVEGSVLPELPGYIIVGSPAANGQFYVNYQPGDYDGEYDIFVTINGEEAYPIVDGTYEAVEGENHVVVTVSADGYKDKVATNDFYYHYPTTAPAPEFNWNAETFTMEAVCNGHTVVLYKDGVEVENPYTVEQTDAEQTIVFSAMTLAGDEDNNSDVVYADPVVVPAKEVIVTPPAAPTYEVSFDADYMYITFSCDEGELTIYDEYGQVVAENPVVIERPEYDETADAVYVHFSAKATKDGVDSEIIYVTEEVIQKAKPEPQPTEKTGAPTFNGYTEDGLYAYFVEINETEPSTIYYRVIYPDGTVSDWAEYEETLSFTDEGSYRVEAYAVADGKLPSEVIAYEFTLDKPSGVSEITDGKQVAGVRYFNMAGQEMQQANGLTIMITTYTDGTTSAMKVIK